MGDFLLEKIDQGRGDSLQLRDEPLFFVSLKWD